MQDIAKKLNLSRATVSYAMSSNWRTKGISPATHQAVLKAAQELRYRRNRIATSLRTRKTMTVGVLVPVLAGEMYVDLIQGIESVLGSEYTLLLGCSGYSAAKERRVLESFEDRMVDGLIVVNSGDEQNIGLFKRIYDANPCMVQVDRYYEAIPADVVEADNDALATAAVSHLAELGHRRIAYIRSPHLTSAARDRLAGYQRAMTRLGLEPCWFPVELKEDASSVVDYGCGQAKIAMQRDGDRPTAIVAHDDGLAVKVLRGIEEMGLSCPRDVSICSAGCAGGQRSDDFLLRIHLTTVRWSVEEMGRQAARFLLDRLETPEVYRATRRTIRIAGQLHPGDSTVAATAR